MRLEIYDSKDLNFVELNITGSNDSFVRCDKESRYIDSVVFNLFTPCFEESNKLYEYYGPTKYNSRKIIPLRNELMKYKEKLEAIKTAKDFENFCNEHYLGGEFLEALKNNRPGWENNPEYVRDKLIIINYQLIQVTELCADEERILWVAGY